MKIIENGVYPKENIVECKECGCKFQYFNSEVVIDMTTPDEEAMFGGFGVYKHIQCPCCKRNVEISHSFKKKKTLSQKIQEWKQRRSSWRRKNLDFVYYVVIVLNQKQIHK